MEVTLTRVTNDAIRAIDEAAANCYNTDINNEDYKPGRLMKGCINSGHMSVTEFAHFTFHIEGVSRALTHQLVRHRMASFAQRSQRYCGENGFEYIIPPSIVNDEKAARNYLTIMDRINCCYETLQELDIPNEDARYVLPNACATTIEVSMNLRELMHFMNERLCTRAQWEIRELAHKMRHEVCKNYPELKPFLVPKCEAHGIPYCPERTSCGRHKKLAEIVNN